MKLADGGAFMSYESNPLTDAPQTETLVKLAKVQLPML